MRIVPSTCATTSKAVAGLSPFSSISRRWWNSSATATAASWTRWRWRSLFGERFSSPGVCRSGWAIPVAVPTCAEAQPGPLGVMCASPVVTDGSERHAAERVTSRWMDQGEIEVTGDDHERHVHQRVVQEDGPAQPEAGVAFAVPEQEP